MEIYLVGGAVRDRQLGLPVSERDWVVVGATARDMLDRGYRQVGKDFPVFLHPETGEEYALARTERKTGPGYTGFECHAGADVSLEDDLRRRDLTINAMAEDGEGNLIDPYGGQEDLQQGLLRHVSPAFREDPVRILRTARFAARFGRYGFHVAHSTNRLMRSMVESGEVEHLVPERIWAELAKALASDAPQRFLTVLRGCGALAIVFPELDAQFGENNSAHDQQPAPSLVLRLSEGAAQSSDPLVRFGLLLWSLQPAQIDEFCGRLKAPREYCQLARQAAQWRETLGGKDATALVSAMQACNAFRQRDRWERLLEVQRLAGVFDQAGVTRLDHALNTAAEVTAADFSERNLQGPAIGEAIFRERVRRVDALVKLTGDSGG